MFGFLTLKIEHLPIEFENYSPTAKENTILDKIYEWRIFNASIQQTSFICHSLKIIERCLLLNRDCHAFSIDLVRHPIDHLQQANQELLDKVQRQRKSKAISYDLNSTHADAYGNQESITLFD